MINYIKKIVGRTKIYNTWARARDIRSQELKRMDVMKHYASDKIFLNIGSGRFVKSNWRLLDYSDYPSDIVFPTSLIDYNVNLTKLESWPIRDNSVDLIYTSHCLEHLGNEVAMNVLAESCRILKPGGCIRITLPDAELPYTAFRNGNDGFFLN